MPRVSLLLPSRICRMAPYLPNSVYSWGTKVGEKGGRGGGSTVRAAAAVNVSWQLG